jgi:hypothetical protein
MTQTFLHLGCGPRRKNATTRGFNRDEWQELTLDPDPAFKPDHVAKLTDLSAVASGSVDALFCSHSLEQLYVHEVAPALAEFRRVLKPEGFAVITGSDLQGVAELIVADKLTETAYESAVGPIRPIDIVFGHAGAIAAGNLRMVRHCGFTQKVLAATLQAAGFRGFASARRPAPLLDLWVIATPEPKSDAALRELAAQHFPYAAKK